MHLFETAAYSIWLPADRVALLCMFSLCEDRRAFVATVRQHLFPFYLFLKSHHETRRPRCKSLGTGRRCSAGHRKVVWIRCVAKTQHEAAQNFFWGEVWVLYQSVWSGTKETQTLRCAFSRSPRGCIPTSLRLCIAAVPAGIQNEPGKPLLCLQLLCPCGTEVWNFAAAITNGWVLPSIFSPPHDEFKGEQWHAGLGVCNCAFLCMFTGTTSYRCAAHLTRHSCVDFSSCHMVWDLKLIYIPLQGGLCSLIYEIELASSFCSCSVITCTAAGEKLYATWLFDNELSIATHSKKNKKIKTPLQCLF